MQLHAYCRTQGFLQIYFHSGKLPGNSTLRVALCSAVTAVPQSVPYRNNRVSYRVKIDHTDEIKVKARDRLWPTSSVDDRAQVRGTSEYGTIVIE